MRSSCRFPAVLVPSSRRPAIVLLSVTCDPVTKSDHKVTNLSRECGGKAMSAFVVVEKGQGGQVGFAGER